MEPSSDGGDIATGSGSRCSLGMAIPSCKASGGTGNYRHLKDTALAGVGVGGGIARSASGAVAGGSGAVDC